MFFVLFFIENSFVFHRSDSYECSKPNSRLLNAYLPPFRKLLSRPHQGEGEPAEKQDMDRNMAFHQHPINEAVLGETKENDDESNQCPSDGWSRDFLLPEPGNSCDSFGLPNGGKSREKVSPQPKAYVACTKRNQETIAGFLTELTNQGLTYKTIFQTTLGREESLFAFDESYKPVKIFEITL